MQLVGRGAPEGLTTSLSELGLRSGDQRQIPVQGWKDTVEGSLEDDVLSLHEEAALIRVPDQGRLSVSDVDANGAHRNKVKSAVMQKLVPWSKETLQGADG